MSKTTGIFVCLLLSAGILCRGGEESSDKKNAKGKKEWVEEMKKVHAKFKGEKKTFAHFGDSITITQAFWGPLKWGKPKNMDEATAKDYELVKGYMAGKCWRDWKNPKYGNDGGKTIRWAHQKIDAWLKTTKAEAALIMFGTNDLGPVKVNSTQEQARRRAIKCGAVVKAHRAFDGLD